jgi:hypothetical protein
MPRKSESCSISPHWMSFRLMAPTTRSMPRHGMSQISRAASTP